MMNSNVTDLQAQLERVAKERDELRAALKPFACVELDWLILRLGANNPSYDVFVDIGDARCCNCGSSEFDDMDFSGFTTDDIRRARKALGED